MEWRERLVQTICEARNAYFADDVEHRRDGRDPDEVIADAILSAIDAAGCVIVPRVCVRCGRTIERPK